MTHDVLSLDVLFLLSANSVFPGRRPSQHAFGVAGRQKRLKFRLRDVPKPAGAPIFNVAF
jgi:hypothetical protein